MTLASLAATVSPAAIHVHLAALEGERFTTEQRRAAAAYISGELESFEYRVTADRFGGTGAEAGVNLVAQLPGEITPHRVLVVGAHYDTVEGTPGADDNASGVAGLLEMARVLADSSHESTIEFVFFDLEESPSGHLGSSHFVEQVAASARDLIGMVNLEMIGFTCDTPGCQQPFSDVSKCLKVSTEDLDVGTWIGIVANEASARLVDSWRSAAAGYVPGLRVEFAQVAGRGTCFPDTRRSDHSVFWDRGYRALMVTDTAEFRNPHYQMPSDTLATLDLDFMTEVVRAAVVMVAKEAGKLP